MFNIFSHTFCADRLSHQAQTNKSSKLPLSEPIFRNFESPSEDDLTRNYFLGQSESASIVNLDVKSISEQEKGKGEDES